MTKETTVKVPQARLLKLVSGEQIIAGIYVTEGSDFLRLNDPYKVDLFDGCLLYTSPSPRDRSSSRMPSSA